jgi:hypothetical protein
LVGACCSRTLHARNKIDDHACGLLQRMLTYMEPLLMNRYLHAKASSRAYVFTQVDLGARANSAAIWLHQLLQRALETMESLSNMRTCATGQREAHKLACTQGPTSTSTSSHADISMHGPACSAAGVAAREQDLRLKRHRTHLVHAPVLLKRPSKGGRPQKGRPTHDHKGNWLAAVFLQAQCSRAWLCSADCWCRSSALE